MKADVGNCIRSGILFGLILGMFISFLIISLLGSVSEHGSLIGTYFVYFLLLMGALLAGAYTAHLNRDISMLNMSGAANVITGGLAGVIVASIGILMPVSVIYYFLDGVFFEIFTSLLAFMIVLFSLATGGIGSVLYTEMMAIKLQTSIT
ncbi:hypothetical protein CUJ83_03825 [Methanocella sp. CWC-04]|uniref:Uncharacterized protein n=1 Tax=Methanooceanicella nereidis TaxID=2052831 RepID=A0AAP2RDB5_9EURY|nr:hypothetical protein [Methanocella sp. CWC-04]